MVGYADSAIELFDFCFSENGLTAFRLGSPLPSQVVLIDSELHQAYRRRKVQEALQFCVKVRG
jgi:hypothetical protein